MRWSLVATSGAELDDVMQAALEDLVKAPSNKLFPFVKLLLAENSLLQRSAATAEPNGVKVCYLLLAMSLSGRVSLYQASRSSRPALCMLTASQPWRPCRQTLLQCPWRELPLIKLPGGPGLWANITGCAAGCGQRGKRKPG